MRKIGKVDCIVCGYKDAMRIVDEEYNGFRGICPECGCNWPES